MFMKIRSCAQVLETLVQAGEEGRMPWVLLRPRTGDEQTVFEGDFDFLVDARRFDEILETVFTVCQAAGISFIVRQSAAFKRQIELLDAGGGRVTLELWPHAEFRLHADSGSLTRAALDYSVYEATPAAQRPGLLAAMFILHLHHKQKDLQADQVQTRLDHFLEEPQLAPPLRDILAALRDGKADLQQGHARALEYLRAQRISWTSPWQLVGARVRRALCNALRWPAPRTMALVGPDGSGKTALTDVIRQSPQGGNLRYRAFKRLFRQPLYYLRRSESRNVRDEKMLWLVLPVAWLNFSLRCWLTVWAPPTLFDRYFYDYFIRDVRETDRPLRRIGAYDLCTALVPRPQRLIVATCPADVIHLRKVEMTADSIDQLYRVYLDQVVRTGVPETLFCHTGVALHASSRQVAAFLGDNGEA